MAYNRQQGYSGVEDVLPHNFALLVDRRGAGWTALLRRWLSAIKQQPDDQLALRLTLQQLAKTDYFACDDQPLQRALQHMRSQIIRVDRSQNSTYKGCVHVRVDASTSRGWRRILLSPCSVASKTTKKRMASPRIERGTFRSSV